MARLATTLAMNFATDAAFRALMQGIDAGIQAMGWVRSADTGQMNTATVLAPTGSNQDRGYMMWEATDALAGTYPMKFRINFGSSGGATTLRWRPRVGYLTDGAGNFSGITDNYDRGDVDGPVSSATAYECMFSGDTNRIAFVLFNNYPGTTTQVGFSLERTHDNTGADTTLGMWHHNAQAGNNNRHRTLVYTGTPVGEQIRLVGLYPPSTGTLIGTQVGLYTIHPIYCIALNPSTQWLTYLPSEISDNTIISADLYGATRSWLTTRAMRGAYDLNRLAIRWDP